MTLASAAAAICPRVGMAAEAGRTADLPLVVFSKVYQELKLNYQEAAELTAEAGLNGVDCPVRPKGEIEPEQAAEEMPRYFEALRKRNLSLPLLTTAITSPATPHTERVLRTARALGVKFYRLGARLHAKDVPLPRQIREAKAELKDLAALNRDLGIGAIFQNHSPSGRKYLGGDLAELRELVADLDPAQVGVAFDIGHALVVHGDAWREHFDHLRPHIRVVYVKDVTRAGTWLPLGKGAIFQTGFFSLLRQIRYSAPISLHVEYDWDEGGKSRDRATLLKALRQDQITLRGWV
jgi:sugar phosphate isomerase/epimerase